MDHHAPIANPPIPASAPSPANPRARAPRRRTADYRWTQPKVIAFLEALAQCGMVAEAARVVGMSRTSAYRLRTRMGSARFDAAFEGARRTGIRARAAASVARVAARSVWEGMSLAELVAQERRLPQGDSFGPQGDVLAAQSDGRPTQSDRHSAQGNAFPRKGTKNTPGPCNTRSMSGARGCDQPPLAVSTASQPLSVHGSADGS